MRMIALIASIVVATMTGVFALKASDSALYLKLALKFDVLGINPHNKIEKNRLDQIDLLPISKEKKQILANHTIFLGASLSMIELALGEPIDKIETSATKDAPAVERWVYHFEEDLNPTALEFNDGKLTSAFAVTKR